jgi:HlyD family secretion protein
MQARLRRPIFWSVPLLILAAALFFSFRPRALSVDLAPVERGELLVTVADEGQTRVHDVYVLSAPVTGHMRRIDAHVGDPVAGLETVVAEIEPIDPAFLDPRSEAQARADIRAAESAEALARAEVEMAQAEFDFAHREFDRARELIQQHTISQHDLDEAERTHRTARAALTTALAALEMRAFQVERARAELLSPSQTQQAHGQCACVRLLAPVTGRVLRVVQQSEGVVTAGAPLVEVGDPRDLEIVVDLLSADAVRVETGQRVIIESWGGDLPLAGRVRLVEPFGFTKTSALGIEEQRVNVIVDLTSPADDWRRLAHGYQIDARIVLAEEPNALKVPLTALFRDGGAWAVFLDEGGRARLRRVNVGRRNGTAAEILEGLAEGDVVVVHPSNRIADGVRIAARDS